MLPGEGMIDCNSCCDTIDCCGGPGVMIGGVMGGSGAIATDELFAATSQAGLVASCMVGEGHREQNNNNNNNNNNSRFSCTSVRLISMILRCSLCRVFISLECECQDIWFLTSACCLSIHNASTTLL